MHVAAANMLEVSLRLDVVTLCSHCISLSFSLAVTTFVVSALVSHENKLDMVHVQNSTLAGGVAVGTVCNLLLGAHGAVLIGIIAGTVSVLGYRYLTVS